MSLYEDIKNNIKEADIGYDYWGSKEMEPFEGKAFIQYYGGPGNLEYLHKARNGRYIWKDSSNPGDPYLFNSYADALKVQKEVGGEIMSYQRDWLGETENNIKESSTEDYWDAKEIDRVMGCALLKSNKTGAYLITNDAYLVKRFTAKGDEEAKEIFNEWRHDKNNELTDYVYDRTYDKI